MGVPWEDMMLDEDATAEELKMTLDRRNAEIARVVAGVENGSI